MMIDIGMLKKLGKEPVGAVAPCGGDVSYDPASEAIQAEFDKLTRASKAMTPVDWPRVVALCVEILSRKSKDFTIACRLGVGLLHTERIAGLGLGAEVLGDMIGTFWNDMHPPIGRERRRLNALAWWKEHAKTFLNTFDATDGFADDIESAAAALRRLDGILAEKIADAPGSRDLIVALERMPVATASEPDGPPERTTGSEPSIAEGVAPGEPEKSIPLAPASATTNPSSAVGGLATPSDSGITVASPPARSRDRADAALRESLDRFLRLSDMYLAFDPRAPLSYRLRRIGIWTAVEVPPRSADGQTMVAAPDPDRLGRLDRLVASRDIAKVVPDIESLVQEHIFCLDSSYLCAMALGQLGDRYDGARNAVELETLSFVKRLPGIETLCFSGGAPFAAPRTRSWLYALESSNGARRDAAASEDSVPRTISEARGQAAAGELRGGIATLSAALRAAPDGKTRFRLSTALAGLLIEGRQFAHARLQGNEIVRLIDKFDLTDWDPGQAIDGLTALLPCLTSRDDDPPLADPLRDRVHALLGRVGPDRLSMTGPIAG